MRLGCFNNFLTLTEKAHGVRRSRVKDFSVFACLLVRYTLTLHTCRNEIICVSEILVDFNCCYVQLLHCSSFKEPLQMRYNFSDAVAVLRVENDQVKIFFQVKIYRNQKFYRNLSRRLMFWRFITHNIYFVTPFMFEYDLNHICKTNRLYF